MATATRKKSSGFIVDFSKDEGGGGGGVRLPEGDYKAKLLSAKPTTSSEKGTKGIEVVFQITEGKKKGKKITDRLWNSPKAIWRFRALLEAFGVKVPKKAADVLGPLLKLKGKELGITLSDDEYEGRIRSRVSDFIDLDALAGADDDEDEDEDDEEEDEDEDAEDDDDEDSDDDEDEDDEEEEDEEEEQDYSDWDVTALKKELKKRKIKISKFSSKKAIRLLVEDDEEDDDEDEDEIEDIELDEL